MSDSSSNTTELDPKYDYLKEEFANIENIAVNSDLDEPPAQTNPEINMNAWGNKKDDFYGKDSTDEDAEYEEGIEATEIIKEEMKKMK